MPVPGTMKSAKDIPSPKKRAEVSKKANEERLSDLL